MAVSNRVFSRPAVAPSDLATLDGPATAGPPPAGRAQRLRSGAMLVTGLVWLSNWSVAMVHETLHHHPHIDRFAAMRFGLALLGCGLCYILHLGLRRLDARSFGLRAVILALLMPGVGEGFSWISYFGTQWANPALGTSYDVSEGISGAAYWVWFFMAWAALYLALRYSFEVKEHERRCRQVETLAHAAQLRTLRNQINPHFLFNTLNTISSLILDRRIDAAEAMVRRLSEFFRISLAVDPVEDIRLAEELRLQRYYLEIEQVRFPDLTIAVHIPAHLLDALVPTLILQPLIEKAVKYAITRSEAPATICIEAGVVGHRLRLAVVDDGAGTPAKGGAGIGLRNVRDRLANRFGDDFAFAARPRPTGGFIVEFELPLRYAP